jgi:minichromosome maintenance protein 10
MLYSIVRLTSNRQGYDVPVDGDWVTIAVIAERGDISVSRGAKSGPDDQDGEGANGLETRSHEKLKGDRKQKRTRPTNNSGSGGKKYLTLKLVDFGRRSSDPQTGKISIGGDALLNLILFEADNYSAENAGEGAAGRVHKGGSGGAFENSAMLRAGAVIAVMSAKILKPFQVGHMPVSTCPQGVIVFSAWNGQTTSNG